MKKKTAKKPMRKAEGGSVREPRNLAEASSQTVRTASRRTGIAGTLNRIAKGYPEQNRTLDDSPEKMRRDKAETDKIKARKK